MVVYKISNNITGKLYIGITKCSLLKRWREHKCRASYDNKHLYVSMRKYGLPHFVIEEIFRVETDEELYLLERYCIAFYKSNDRNYGYNNSTGGECSMKGVKHSDLTKKKISEVQKGKRNSIKTEFKKGSEHPFYGKKFSDEHREKLSLINKGKILSLETIEKIRQSTKGRTVIHSEETKRKISASHIGMVSSEEARRKISIKLMGNKCRLGKPHSEETKRIISLKNTGFIQSEETKAKRSKSITLWWAKKKEVTNGLL